MKKKRAEKSIEEKVKEITEKIDSGIQEMFESEKFKSYLNTISKFYRYSFNNTVLIAIQKPTATAVAGFKAWEQKFDRHVKKGEKGIQILAPILVKQEKLKLPEKEETKDEKDKFVIRGFKPTYVFDIDQTEGKELPKLCIPITGKIGGFEEKKKILMELSPVPITFETMENMRANGYFSRTEQKIVVKDSLEEAHLLKTMIHEIAHATIHNEEDKIKDRQTKEVEAESIAYTVCNYMGLDTSSYSFGYIAGWSENKELKELKKSMELIRSVAIGLIEKIEEKQLAMEKSKEHSLSQDYKELENVKIITPTWNFESLKKNINLKLAKEVAEYER